MAVSNGNFINENGNVVNIVQLLRDGSEVPLSNNYSNHMCARSGWFTDETGTPVNIISLIGDISGNNGSVTGIKINNGATIEPDENGVLHVTISGDGSTVIDNALSDSSENPVQNKVIKQECTLTTAQKSSLKSLVE